MHEHHEIKSKASSHLEASSLMFPQKDIPVIAAHMMQTEQLAGCMCTMQTAYSACLAN